MKSNIKFLTLIMLITSMTAKPSLVGGYSINQINGNKKFVPTEKTFELLKDLTIQQAQNDAENNNKRGFSFVHRIASNKLPELNNLLKKEALSLSTETRISLYNYYLDTYNKTQTAKQNQIIFSAASTSNTSTSNTSTSNTSTSNDDIRYVAILLKILNPENNKNNQLISDLIQKTISTKQTN